MQSTPVTAPLPAWQCGAKASKPRTELSVCKALLFFKTSVTPLLPCHRGPGNWALGLFPALRTVLHQTARFIMGSSSGSRFERVCAFSIRPERQRREGGEGPRPPVSLSSACLFPSVWVFLRRKRNGRRRKHGKQTSRLFQNVLSYLEHWGEKKEKGKWNTQRAFSEHFQRHLISRKMKRVMASRKYSCQ